MKLCFSQHYPIRENLSFSDKEWYTTRSYRLYKGLKNKAIVTVIVTTRFELVVKQAEMVSIRQPRGHWTRRNERVQAVASCTDMRRRHRERVQSRVEASQCQLSNRFIIHARPPRVDDEIKLAVFRSVPRNQNSNFFFYSWGDSRTIQSRWRGWGKLFDV